MHNTFECPFSVGDVVRFTPQERTIHQYQNINVGGIEIGQEAEIKEIKDNMYLYFENGTGGWPWNEFAFVRHSNEPYIKSTAKSFI